MKPILQISAALCCLSLAWLAYRASLAADAVTRAAVEAPQAVLSVVTPALGIVDARTAYVADLLAVNLARLDQLADRTERDAKMLLTTTATNTNARVAEVVSIARDTSDKVTDIATAIRADLKPTIDSIPPAVASVQALTDDAKASWDDLYFDVKAATESATVTLTSVAMASESIRESAPKLSESAIGIGRSADGIAADVHTATSDFVKPRTGWQRLRGWMETVAKIGVRIL